jgi:hypothetical protein
MDRRCDSDVARWPRHTARQECNTAVDVCGAWWPPCNATHVLYTHACTSIHRHVVVINWLLVAVALIHELASFVSTRFGGFTRVKPRKKRQKGQGKIKAKVREDRVVRKQQEMKLGATGAKGSSNQRESKRQMSHKSTIIRHERDQFKAGHRLIGHQALRMPVGSR